MKQAVILIGGALPVNEKQLADDLTFLSNEGYEVHLVAVQRAIMDDAAMVADHVILSDQAAVDLLLPGASWVRRRKIIGPFGFFCQRINDLQAWAAGQLVLFTPAHHVCDKIRGAGPYALSVALFYFEAEVTLLHNFECRADDSDYAVQRPYLHEMGLLAGPRQVVLEADGSKLGIFRQFQEWKDLLGAVTDTENTG